MAGSERATSAAWMKQDFFPIHGREREFINRGGEETDLLKSIGR